MKQESRKVLPSPRVWLRSVAFLGLGAVASVCVADTTKAISVVAPVESLNCLDSSFQVLGIKLRAVDETVLATLCESLADGSQPYAAVAAAQDADGKLVATSVTSIGVPYVPGVSPVYIAGNVTEARSDVGAFQVSGSAIVSFVTLSPSVGERLEVVGVQPQPGGVIVASAVYPAISRSSSGVRTDSIIGSGIATNSIIGSGVQANSIIGSGVATNSIIGSGVQANSIIGSGVATNSIIGSGVQSDSIIGSGVAANSIIGSGVQADSIIGSGITAESIIGSGVQADSIIGSGVQKSSIIGSGSQKTSIIGSGIQRSSIIGSGSTAY